MNCVTLLSFTFTLNFQDKLAILLLPIGLLDLIMGIGALSLNTSAALQSGAQARLQQAQREAARAEQNAQSLQASAQNAKQEARRAAQEAKTLSAQSDQASVDARSARQNVTEISNQQQRDNVAQQVTNVKFTPMSGPPPVVNAQGQLTGTMVNTSA